MSCSGLYCLSLIISLHFFWDLEQAIIIIEKKIKKKKTVIKKVKLFECNHFVFTRHCVALRTWSAKKQISFAHSGMTGLIM